MTQLAAQVAKWAAHTAADAAMATTGVEGSTQDDLTDAVGKAADAADQVKDVTKQTAKSVVKQ